MARSLAELGAELAALIEQASDKADRYNSDGKYDHQTFTADLATIHSRALSLLREAGTETAEEELEWRHEKGDHDQESRLTILAAGLRVPLELEGTSRPYEYWVARAELPQGYVDLRVWAGNGRWEGHLDFEGGSVTSELLDDDSPDALKLSLTSRLSLLRRALGTGTEG